MANTKDIKFTLGRVYFHKVATAVLQTYTGRYILSDLSDLIYNTEPHVVVTEFSARWGGEPRVNELPSLNPRQAAGNFSASPSDVK